jgi:hypothetical protein
MRAITTTFVIIAISGGSLQAQERTADLHLNYARTTQTHQNSWGGGAALQLTWGGSNAPAKLNTSLGADYTKQENGGPSQTSVSTDFTVQPGGSSALTPYAGGSASANWSGGAASQWSGSRLGLEAVGGLQFKPSPDANISWKLEERFGYVRGQEHQLTTRLGMLVSI